MGILQTEDFRLAGQAENSIKVFRTRQETP
jgi:hypothetical protein